MKIAEYFIKYDIYVMGMLGIPLPALMIHKHKMKGNSKNITATSLAL